MSLCFTAQQVYEGAKAGTWKQEDPALCGCKGSGWFCSDVDTWHPCHVHPAACSCHPEGPLDDFGRCPHEIKEAFDKEISRLCGLAGSSKVELGADRWLKRSARRKINRLLDLRGTGGPSALDPMGASREPGVLDRPAGLPVARFAKCDCGVWGEIDTPCCGEAAIPF